jgi:hypothetical protein
LERLAANVIGRHDKHAIGPLVGYVDDSKIPARFGLTESMSRIVSPRPIFTGVSQHELDLALGHTVSKKMCG